MSEYMNNMGIGDLCQHTLSMSAYMFNVAKGDLCQHIISKSPYIDGMGDLCQHRLSTLEFKTIFASIESASLFTPC